MRDHLSSKTTDFWQTEAQHFNDNEHHLTPKTTCLERPHFYGQWGGPSRQVLLYYFQHCFAATDINRYHYYYQYYPSYCSSSSRCHCY